MKPKLDWDYVLPIILIISSVIVLIKYSVFYGAVILGITTATFLVIMRRRKKTQDKLINKED